MKFVKSERILVTKTFKQSIHHTQHFSNVRTRKITPTQSRFSLEEIRNRGKFSY